MIIRKITANELMEARNISALAFEWSHDTSEITPEEYISDTLQRPSTKEEASWDKKLAAFTDEGEMMAVLSVYPYEIHFDGGICKMGGLGGLCTYPQHRKKGAMTECIKASYRQMYEDGQIFSYLYGFSDAFYEKVGFIKSSTSIRWTFDIDKIPDYKYEGVVTMFRGEKEADINEYEEVYRKFSNDINMMIVRDKYDWDELRKANPFMNTTMSFLYKNKEGVPKGYIIFSKEYDGDIQVMKCSEMAFDSFEGIRAIMAFVRTFGADYQKVTFKAPRHFMLECFCTDYAQSESTRVIKPNGMARVIDVKKVLEVATYKGTGDVTITIIDNIIEENNKTFKVYFRDNQACKIDSVTEEDTDIVMTINEFSAAIIGNYNVEHFEYRSRIKVKKNIDNLEKIFYIKKNWINNFF